MKVLASLALLALVNYGYSADTTVVNSCHDAILPEVTLTINNTVCAKGPCVVSPGSEISILVSFDTPIKLEHVKPKVTATTPDHEIELPLNQDDACDGFVNTKCPVAAGGHVDYEYDFVLSDAYPEVQATMTSTLLDLDNDGAEVTCYTLDIIVKKS